MKRALILMVAALAIPQFSQAHHSTNLYVDVSKKVSVQGEFESLKLVNPHALLTFWAPNAKGERVLWSVETHAPGNMIRLGWRPQMFKRGEKITVIGNPSRNGSPYLNLVEVVFASDGYHLSPQKANPPRVVSN